MRNCVRLAVAASVAFAWLFIGPLETAEAAYRRSAPSFAPRMYSAPRVYSAPRYVPQRRFVAPRYAPQQRAVAPRHAAVHPSARLRGWPGKVRGRLSHDRIPRYRAAVWSTTGFIAGIGAYYYFAVPDEVVLMPTGLSNDGAPFDAEQYIRSLEDDGSPPTEEDIAEFQGDNAPGEQEGKPWASITIDNDGKVFSAWGKDDAMTGMFETYFSCTSKSRLKKTCSNSTQQGWAVAVFCRNERFRMGVAESSWTAKGAIALAFQKALKNGNFEKRDCKLVERISADGAHLKYAPPQE